MTSRSTLSRRGLLAVLSSLALPLRAQLSWPAKPVHIIVAYPAGGVSDVIARLLGEKLAAQLGQPVLVENRAGASGTIGMDAVAKAAPDGYTLGFSAISPLALSPHLGKLPYDAQKDILPVVSVMYSPVLLLATPATSAKDFGQLLADARARPEEVRWATSGPASLGNIVLEQLQAAANVRFTHVPYKVGGQQITDALGGQFEVLSVNPAPSLMQHVKGGRLRALAVGAPTRLESLSNVPTLGELGYPDANLTSVFGIFAPSGLPRAVLERLNAEINKALALPDVRSRLLGSENVPTGGSARDFSREIVAESETNARIIKASGIKGD